MSVCSRLSQHRGQHGEPWLAPYRPDGMAFLFSDSGGREVGSVKLGRYSTVRHREMETQ